MVSPRTPRETPRKSSSSYHAFHGIPRGTPIVELKSLSEELGCVILAKCEHLHPGGSGAFTLVPIQYDRIRVVNFIP